MDDVIGTAGVLRYFAAVDEQDSPCSGRFSRAHIEQMVPNHPTSRRGYAELFANRVDGLGRRLDGTVIARANGVDGDAE